MDKTAAAFLGTPLKPKEQRIAVREEVCSSCKDALGEENASRKVAADKEVAKYASRQAVIYNVYAHNAPMVRDGRQRTSRYLQHSPNGRRAWRRRKPTGNLFKRALHRGKKSGRRTGAWLIYRARFCGTGHEPEPCRIKDRQNHAHRHRQCLQGNMRP